MISDLPRYMVICLIITIICELLLSFVLGVRNKKDFLNITLVNVLTNPIVVVIPFVLSIYFGKVIYYIILAILEILTVIVEGFIYHKYLKYKKTNPYLLALYLNIFSYMVGIFMQRFM